MLKFVATNATNATNVENETCSKLICHDRNTARSSLPLQIALYANAWLFPIWLSITVLNLDAKYHSLTGIYKPIAIAAFFVFSFFEGLRLYLGYMGNLGKKIPELASCWLISILVQLPLETFLLFSRGISSRGSEIFVDSLMLCLLLVEILAGIVALTNFADHRAKVFYLTRLYATRT